MGNEWGMVPDLRYDDERWTLDFAEGGVQEAML